MLKLTKKKSYNQIRVIYLCLIRKLCMLSITLTRYILYDFFTCSSLRSVTFEKGSQLKYMVEGVFCDCEALTSIEIPASVEMIDMYYCINLANIYCYPSIPPILNDFRCKNFVLYVPSQSLEAYKNSSWSEYYSSIKTIQ